MAISGKSQTKGVELLIMNYGVKTEEAHIENTSDEDFDFTI